jgi:uncharacterized protein (DUF1684 family)
MRSPIFTCMLLTIACAGTPASNPERIAAARAFQHEYDQSLRDDDVSVLTAVAAYYLGENGLGEHEPLEFELPVEAGTSTLRLLAGPERLQVAIDGREHVVRDAQLLEVDATGRWRLAISRQEQDWRVLVHDRDAEARRRFTSVGWFPIDVNAIVDARFEPLAVREPQQLQTSRGVTKTLYLAGVYRFELDGQSLALQTFGYAAEPSAGEPLLIPFRDTTTGETSYAAGRYLEPSAGETVLDFNRATNPLCAYSEHYNCPMPPAFNRLDRFGIAISAGARAPADH